MERSPTEHLKKIARACRRTLEEYAWSHRTSEAPWHRAESLRGLCAIGAAFLKETLAVEAGIQAELQVGKFVEGKFPGQWQDQHRNGHAWCELSNGTILDITASQFQINGKNLPKILILKRGDPTHARYQEGKPYRTPKQFIWWGRFGNPWGKIKKISHMETLKKLQKGGSVSKPPFRKKQ